MAAVADTSAAGRHLVVVSDTRGRVLWRAGSAQVLRRADSIAFVEGADWSEKSIGTNGISLALDRLTGMISSALSAEGVAHHIQRASSMFTIRFAEGEGRNFADMQAAETFRFTPFFHALLDNGIYVAPSPFETWFVSDALNDADFELIEAALKPAAQAAAAARPAN